jgi:hypothetical protein
MKFWLLVFILVAVMWATVELFAVYGEDYKYNLSKSEIHDEWITQACMKFSINTPSCDEVYGGILDHVSEGKLK